MLRAASNVALCGIVLSVFTGWTAIYVAQHTEHSCNASSVLQVDTLVKQLTVALQTCKITESTPTVILQIIIPKNINLAQLRLEAKPTTIDNNKTQVLPFGAKILSHSGIQDPRGPRYNINSDESPKDIAISLFGISAFATLKRNTQQIAQIDIAQSSRTLHNNGGMKASPLLLVAAAVYSPAISPPRVTVISEAQASKSNQVDDYSDTRSPSDSSDSDSASLLPVNSQTFKTTRNPDHSQGSKISDTSQFVLFSDSMSSQSGASDPKNPRCDLNSDETEKSPEICTKKFHAGVPETELTRQLAGFSQTSERDSTIANPLTLKPSPGFIESNIGYIDPSQFKPAPSSTEDQLDAMNIDSSVKCSLELDLLEANSNSVKFPRLSETSDEEVVLDTDKVTFKMSEEQMPHAPRYIPQPMRPARPSHHGAYTFHPGKCAIAKHY